MDFNARVSKVFAVPFLIFASSAAAFGQSDSIYRLPAGTRIQLSMDSEIGSRVSSVDDTFTTTVAAPIKVRNAVVLPAGTVIEGRVTKVSSARAGGRNGRMEIRFETIRFPNNVKRRIDGLLVNELKARPSGTTNVLAILGVTAAGAILGAVSKAENGALIGGGIGAGAGSAVALLKKGRDVYIRTDEEFEIELKSEVTLPVRDY